MILIGDALTKLSELPAESVQTCVTSPPYWGLRDYGVPGQIGVESGPEEFLTKLTEVFEQVRRVLRKDGTLWLNLGDSYANGGCGSRDPERWPKQSRNDHMPRHAKRNSGVRSKNLLGIPWRAAFALQAAGWYLRQDIIWHKPNPMPESVKDRCTKAHEYIFLLSRSPRYYFDVGAIREEAKYKNISKMPPAGWGVGDEPRTAIEKSTAAFHRKSQPKGSFQGKYGERAFRKTGEMRNKRSVWTVAPRPFKDAHFATFPPDLITPCILAGSRPGDTVLDPFFGAGTTGLVASQHGRKYLGIELNPEYAAMAAERIGDFF